MSFANKLKKRYYYVIIIYELKYDFENQCITNLNNIEVVIFIF